MEKRNLYVLVAVIVVAAVVLVASNYTGNSVLGACMETDGGDNPEVPGVNTFENANAVYKDECYAEGKGPRKYVREYFCLDKVESNRYLCEGGCSEDSDGAGYCNEGRVIEITETSK